MFNFLSKVLKRVVYLDYAAATPISNSVVDEMTKHQNLFYNPSALYRDGVKVKSVIQNCKEKIAKEIACLPGHVYFTSSATESINLALRGIVNSYYQNLENNISNFTIPNIITTPIEHPATLETLKDLEKKNLIELKYLPVDELGIVNPRDLSELLDHNTILVSVIHVNNEVGTVQNIKELGRVIYLYNLEREKSGSDQRVSYHVDACQSLNYFKIDMRGMRIDLLSFNSAKLYGPKGFAVLATSPSVQLSPVITGGGQESGLRSGTENLSAIVGGTGAILEASALRSAESLRLSKIQTQVFEIINSNSDYNFIKIVGPQRDPSKRSPNNINLIIKDFPSDEMVIRLDYAGYQVSHKSACASDSEEGSYVLEALGYSKSEANTNIRITMGRGTTLSEMKSLLKVIRVIYTNFVL